MTCQLNYSMRNSNLNTLGGGGNIEGMSIETLGKVSQ